MYKRTGFLLLTLLAFALRLTALDAQSLWYDEGVTAVVAQYDPATLIRWTAADIQPPLYYLVVSAWGQVAGWSEWSLRFVSAAFGVMLVPLMAALTYALTRRRSAALTAALITALHPLLLYYSQEARMYSMLVVLGVVAGYCGLRIANCELQVANGGSPRREWGAWIGYALTATAAVYTHYFAVFLLLAINIAFLLQISPRNPQSATRNSQSAIRPFLLANTAVAVLFAPWISVIVTRLRVDTSYWQGAFKLGEALHDIAIRFTLGETVLESAVTPWLWLYAAVTVWGIANCGLR
ncbi:MAG: glycosyltransferase family 39 protein, partial [Caldilineaceae bacterium]|nr:glycosyltransferase family 39 protein [Caldilineaceae bacterium]